MFFCGSSQKDFDATTHALTRMSPAELMTRRQLRLPLHVLQPPLGDCRHKVGVEDMECRIAKIKEKVDEARGARDSSFAEDDLVRIMPPVRGNKLSPRFSTPVEVERKIGKDTYLLVDGSRWNARRLLPVSDVDGPSDEMENQREVFGDVVPGGDITQNLSGDPGEIASGGEAAVPLRRSSRVKKRLGWHEDSIV